MPYTFVPLRWRDAVAAARWRYEGPYAIYDFEPAALYATALLQKLLHAVVFYAVLDERGELVGIFTFARARDTIEVGVGMRPDLTGKGLGAAFFAAGLDFARRRYHPARFLLNVAAFNERARRVYARAGFVPIRTFRRRTRAGWLEHIEMQRDV